MRDYWAVFGVLVAWYVAFVALDMFRYATAPPPGHLHSSVKGVRRALALLVRDLVSKFTLFCCLLARHPASVALHMCPFAAAPPACPYGSPHL